MGPNIIFDKSFLESINKDESVWLDMFFYTNITPLFFIETLADLEKKVQEGRTPEKVVGNLADKTPDSSSVSNVHHMSLLQGELLGAGVIDMKTGRPVVSGGRRTQLDGQKGVVFEQSPEEEALNRWTKREFLDLERQQAKQWRRALALISPEKHRALFAKWFGNHKPADLNEVKLFSDNVIDNIDISSSLKTGLSLFEVNNDYQTKIIQRWEQRGKPSLQDFAPYFRHCYGVELFYYLAVSANLISQRRTNKVDIAYLYYLPFCMAFTSNDNLHAATVPLFLRSDQSFVPGIDLKSDLASLDRFYSALPDEVKDRGLNYFASQPPHDKSYLVTQLWDRHMKPNWRELNSVRSLGKDRAYEKDLIEKIRRAEKAPSVGTSEADQDSHNVDYMITKHFVSLRKGKWRRFSPEVEKSLIDSQN